MNTKQRRNFVCLFIIYSTIFVILVTFTTLPDELSSIDRYLEFERIIDVKKNDLFFVMADIEKYPLILPDSYVSVEIIDKKDNSIIALETVREAGIQTTFKVKHDFIQNELHQITILDGDAKDTNISVWFNDFDGNKTKILVESNFHFKGIMTPFGIIPDWNLQHALNSILNMFTEYIQNTK